MTTPRLSQDPTAGSGIAVAVRRRPVGAFLALFFTVGQALAFMPPDRGVDLRR